MALRARTEAIATHLTEFLKKTDRFDKTIAFCVDQEHASEMRKALSNLNSDLVATVQEAKMRIAAFRQFALSRRVAWIDPKKAVFEIADERGY